MGVLERHLSLKFSYISQLSIKNVSSFVTFFKLQLSVFQNSLIIHKENKKKLMFNECLYI